MIDYFALLNELRRPWLEPETLKQKFLALSAAVHPDRVHTVGDVERAAAQKRYTELNAAYQCLREPKDRLRHLLELELGALPTEIREIGPDLMEVSLELGRLCRQADRLLAEKAGTTSPLLRVQWFEKAQEATENLQALQQKINRRRDGLLDELKEIDREWNTIAAEGTPARSAALARVENLCALFGYFARWNQQLQERVVPLSF